MKNPFYVKPAVDPHADYAHANALRAAARYLERSAPHAEVADQKVRAQHPDLADAKIWADVQAKLAGLSKSKQVPDPDDA